jgi:hypothetical protein
MKKDKEKVVDDVWTEDHVRSFLNVRSHDNTSEDFHMLLKAYQSMRADDFELFVGFFLEKKRDINALGKDGQTVLAVVLQHRLGAPYATILKSNGAI